MYLFPFKPSLTYISIASPHSPSFLRKLFLSVILAIRLISHALCRPHPSVSQNTTNNNTPLIFPSTSTYSSLSRTSSSHLVSVFIYTILLPPMLDIFFPRFLLPVQGSFLLGKISILLLSPPTLPRCTLSRPTLLSPFGTPLSSLYFSRPIFCSLLPRDTLYSLTSRPVILFYQFPDFSQSLR